MIKSDLTDPDEELTRCYTSTTMRPSVDWRSHWNDHRELVGVPGQNEKRRGHRNEYGLRGKTRTGGKGLVQE